MIVQTGILPHDSPTRCNATTAGNPLMTAASSRLDDGLRDEVILRAPNTGAHRIVVDWTFHEPKTHSGTISASVLIKVKQAGWRGFALSPRRTGRTNTARTSSICL
jgi:hypothetical protein